MSGWIIPRPLKDGSTVFDIGYRMGGKAVRKKGGRMRAEAETALILALGDVATGKIRAHTTDHLATTPSNGWCGGLHWSSRARSRPTETTPATASSRPWAGYGCAT
jgi:hypothetical protein